MTLVRTARRARLLDGLSFNVLPVCDGVVDPPATGHVAGLVTRYHETAHLGGDSLQSTVYSLQSTV